MAAAQRELPAEGTPILRSEFGAREDTLRAFQQRLEEIDQALARLVDRQTRDAEAAQEARRAIADLTHKAHAADEADPAAAKRYRARRARKRAAYHEAKQNLERAQAESARLAREQSQLEQNVRQLTRLRVKERRRRLWARLRGIRDEDDTGARATAHIPPFAIATGVGAIVIVLFVGIGYTATKDAPEGPLFGLLGRGSGHADNPLGPTPEESAAAAQEQLRAMGLAPPAPTRTAPPPTVLRVDDGAVGLPEGDFWPRRFAPPAVYERHSEWPVMFADLTGDGQPEYVLRDKPSQRILVYGPAGGGTYTFRSAIDTGPWPQQLYFADLNADGATDILVPDGGGSTPLYLFVNRGDGTFDTRLTKKPGGAASLAAVDVDRDRILDIVLPTSRGTYLYRGTGAADFAPPRRIDHGTATADPAVADFTNDGLLDVVLREEINTRNPPASNTLRVIALAADLTAKGEARVQTFSPPLASVVAFDFDGKDGMDLGALQVQPGKKGPDGQDVYALVVLWNSGSGRFDVRNYGTVSMGTAVFALDVNGDGRQDLIAGNRAFINEGGRTLTEQKAVLHTGYTWWAHSGDINNDGVPDLVCNVWGRKVVLFYGRT